MIHIQTADALAEAIRYWRLKIEAVALIAKINDLQVNLASLGSFDDYKAAHARFYCPPIKRTLRRWLKPNTHRMAGREFLDAQAALQQEFEAVVVSMINAGGPMRRMREANDK